MREGAIEEHLVQATGGDVGVGGDLVHDHATARVVVGRLLPQLGEQGAEMLGAGVPQPGVEIADDLLLRLVEDRKSTRLNLQSR